MEAGIEPVTVLGVSLVQVVFQPLVWLLATAALGVVWPEKAAGVPCPVLPVAHRIVGVPLAERGRDWCGPAALAAVLRYHGEETSAADIARDIYLPSYHGALNLDLLLWARKRGYEVWAGKGSADILKQAVARDRPVICMVRKRGPSVDRNHFVVVRGYHDARQVWFVDDGGGKEAAVGADDFERDWAECRRWALVIEGRVPPLGSKDNHESD